MTILQRLVPFAKPQGIELTLLPPVRRLREMQPVDVDDYYWGIPEEETYLAKRMLINTPYAGTVYADLGCVEVPSPILRSWGEAEQFYNTVTKRLARIKLRPYRGDDWEGGGGHIHTGELCKFERWAWFTQMQRRPYIAWTCISAVDDINAKSLNGSKYLHTLIKRGCFKIDKGYCIVERRSLPTIEWRAWDAAADWEIQELQLAFVQRYAAWCAAVGPVEPLTGKENLACYGFYHSDYKACARAFKNFVVDDLQLPWRKYAWLVKRNLWPRFHCSWGTRI